MSMPAPAFATVESADLVDLIEAELTRAIVEGRLRPGSRVVEAETARQMGVSRAPVREAARRLERQGILVAKPRHGFYVREITTKEIDDLYAVRLMLEDAAIVGACAQADAAGLARLQAKVDEMRATAPTLTSPQRIQLDLQFHLTLAELSGNARLLRLFATIETEVRMIIALLDNHYVDPLMVANSHQPIIDAIARRNEAAARAHLREHITSAWHHVRDLFARQRPTPTTIERPADEDRL
ncbi:GntR family transcriptional regulator [Aliidongia dinghuensis]|uniref:GntR family transcriptional regulator n=1 Tax=Aliidongia dinghuensis TaxID=1867774 RepID=A0A8J2Z0D2_9PROT|nr:GntR family transcriptional regulator [Aliidongia dinghuensis]GGF44472.1 GntR family transcriptional regulator [Aliidongia dinghuensis]